MLETIQPMNSTQRCEWARGWVRVNWRWVSNRYYLIDTIYSFNLMVANQTEPSGWSNNVEVNQRSSIDIDWRITVSMHSSLSTRSEGTLRNAPLKQHRCLTCFEDPKTEPGESWVTRESSSIPLLIRHRFIGTHFQTSWMVRFHSDSFHSDFIAIPFRIAFCSDGCSSVPLRRLSLT